MGAGSVDRENVMPPWIGEALIAPGGNRVACWNWIMQLRSGTADIDEVSAETGGVFTHILGLLAWG